MTRWEYFESGMALVGVKLGAVTTGLLERYDRYKTYREFLSMGYDDTEARKLTQQKTKLNQSTIARDIYWFERDEDPFYARMRKDKGLHV